MEFKPRDYTAEEEAFSLPRVPALTHPLDSSPQQDIVVDHGSVDFFDPLRDLSAKLVEPSEDIQVAEMSSTPSKAPFHASAMEWVSFKKFLMQRFPVSKMVSISSKSSKIIKSGKDAAVIDKLSTSKHLEEVDDPEKFAEEGIKVISPQEYVARLHELKDEITHAWDSGDRVTTLKLSIKVARLLMDTSVLQFYPTLFALATDVMDMLGDMVLERIRQRAEFAEDGTRICFLPDDFGASNICVDAKETCNNWFCKIGSIHELLPRIYLELAIFPCWRFLHDNSVDSLMRLVMMIRGIADPLASAYCRLYLIHRAQKLPQCDIGHLIACIDDLRVILTQIASVKEGTHGNFSRDHKLLVSLMEPSIEYTMKCIFNDSYQVADILVRLKLGKNQSVLFGEVPCTSIILHHILKELPIEILCSNAVEFLHLIERSGDCSFDQCLNYKILGLKLCERITSVSKVDAIIDKVVQVATQKNSLDEYLKIVDAYLDFILQYQMESCLNLVLSGIFDRVSREGIAEDEMGSLQSVFVKLVTHFDNLENILSLNHFIDILDVMHGSSRSNVSMHILIKATRTGCIRDPTTIQLLFEVARSLHDNIDFSSMRTDDNQQPERLISRFIDMVDHGTELERRLTFLVECRGAFSRMNELKETLVHSSNRLATAAMRDGKDHLNFIKTCLAFSEVTIPSIPAHSCQLNLYLETAEVALLSGLISHSDGLVDSAISCLQNFYIVDGLRMPDNDMDGVTSLLRKLCSFLLMVPGDPAQGITYIPKSIISVLGSQPWMTPRMKIKVLCSIVSLSATYSQKELPYHAMHEEVMGNDSLFFGHPTYSQELISLSGIILQNIVNIIPLEPSQAARGKLALEACNCIVSLFNVSNEILAICSKLVETAQSCLGADNKYLQSTINLIHKQSQYLLEGDHRSLKHY